MDIKNMKPDGERVMGGAARHMRATERAALFGAVQAVWSDVHPWCDQVLQSSQDAAGKGQPGWRGARHCARHVACYTAGHAVASVAVTRGLGYRLPWRALAAGWVLNAVTHYAIDRRRGFTRFLRRIGLGGYLDHATVQRRAGVIDPSGPGTALMECDQAAHRLIAVAASLATACLATRRGERP